MARILMAVFLFLCLWGVSPSVALDERCVLKPDPGHCKAAFPRFAYGIKDGENHPSCYLFIWGGCGGSVPFKTIEECRKSCEGVKEQTVKTTCEEHPCEVGEICVPEPNLACFMAPCRKYQCVRPREHSL
ncbi:hypothetical protein BJ742DRAFT_274678 [Cladochytrium replicatum]|nr:hypothetical protein BJ742DRAFT_274678 [Cladochytrium replicatum]